MQIFACKVAASLTILSVAGCAQAPEFDDQAFFGGAGALEDAAWPADAGSALDAGPGSTPGGPDSGLVGGLAAGGQLAALGRADRSADSIAELVLSMQRQTAARARRTRASEPAPIPVPATGTPRRADPKQAAARPVVGRLAAVRPAAARRAILPVATTTASCSSAAATKTTSARVSRHSRASVRYPACDYAMTQLNIMTPMLALISWTFVMWLWLYATRIPAMQRAGLDPKVIKRKDELDVLPVKVKQVADNYNHLHEQPTVFYALVVYSHLVGVADGLNTKLAWVYVALRISHSLIQATVNFVPLRFAVFAASSLVLMAITARNIVFLYCP
jgi:hypothetical protein